MPSPAIEQLPPWISPRQFEDHFQIDQHTQAVWRFKRRSDLPFTKFGRLVRYRREDVLAFLEKNTVRAAGMAEGA